MRGNAWSIKEIQIVEKYFSILSRKELIELLPKRTWISIQNKAYGILNLKRPNRSWSEKELDILEKNYSKIGCGVTKKDFLKLLPKRNWEVIRNKASQIKVKTYYNGNYPNG